MDSQRSVGVADALTDSKSLTALGRAKRPRTLIAGPYGHPFHPVLVTVPIGAWVASIVFDVVALSNSDQEATLAEGAYWLIGIGVIGALLAAAFGLLDLSLIQRGTRAFTTGLVHMAINLGVVALFIINFLLRRHHGYEDASTTGIVLSLIGIALLGASSWLGGKLAYRFGVRVAGEADQIDGFRSTTGDGPGVK